MAVPSKESSFADEANNTGREEETATDTNQTNDTGVDPNVNLTTSVDLVSDESMQEGPLEVAHSGGIIVNDIEKGHKDHQRNDGRWGRGDEEEGRIASNFDLVSGESMKGGPLEVAHSERIIVNDIEKGRDGERNEDKEEGLVASFPVVQSEQDSVIESDKEEGKLVVTQEDRTHVDVLDKWWMVWLTLSLVVIFIIAIAVPGMKSFLRIST